MTEPVLSRADIEFLLFDWLRVEDLLTAPRFADHSRETIQSALGLAEQLAMRWFEPTCAITDRNEPAVLDGRVWLPSVVGDALRAFNDSGLGIASFPHDVGGDQLPLTVERACFAWFQAGNISIAAYPMLTHANANLLLHHGTPDQIERLVLPMIEGRWAGTMCLSEPQAGSSLSDTATVAEPDGHGRYRLTGTKMWISGGDHELAENILHLVLARTGAPGRGTKGLSLFAVPKWLDAGDGRRLRNDVALVGLNHKMGYRGTVNTVLAFGDGTFAPFDNAGAVGELIGAEGEGLAAMFHMMNEARIAVGTGAAALACRSYRHALTYARQRRQGRPSSDKDPASPPVPIIEHADVRRMVLAAKSYSEGALALCLAAARLVDESQTAATEHERAEVAAVLDLLTPVVKTWPSQFGLMANDLAIQVLGGYGYTRDFPVEQLYRDNRLNQIHEGTTGIQALDLLSRKVRGDRGAGLRLLAARMTTTADRAHNSSMWASQADDLRRALNRLLAASERLINEPDAERALVDAVAYLEVFGHIVVAWIWLDVALAAESEDNPVHRGKRMAARFYFARELPHVQPRLDLLERGDETVLSVSSCWLV